MLDISFIRQNPDRIRQAIQTKGLKLNLDQLLEVDAQRREMLQKLEERRARKNAIALEIQKVSKEDKLRLIDEGKLVKAEIEKMECLYVECMNRFDDLMLRVPSLPRPEVPIGKGEEDNVELRRVGEPKKFHFEPKDHIELMNLHKLVIWDGTRKYAGGRSYALTGYGALLEMAVVRLAVDTLVERGFLTVLPPVLVRERAMTGTGFFPLGKEEAYGVTEDELYLVGTSEVALVSLHADDILNASALPLKYAGMSPCFRREAGAHGKDTRGLYRVHQFTKVEQVVFCLPDEEVAKREHEALLSNAEAILDKLEIPYRVALACTGEIGLGQTRKHEVESWMPGRKAYCETHSCSTLGDFQSRRSNIRLRMPDGSLSYPFTLNNTAVASPRILIPLLENHQNEDGSVTLPKALRPYMNGLEILKVPGS